MTLNEKKTKIKKLVESADAHVLHMVYLLLEGDLKSDWWDEISDAEKKSIEKGLAQADKGELVPHEQVMKKYKKWLTK